uniref:Uncharacterized protein n=1 Tax=Gopherus evgoodei TaxID=1825980 RepID=A0A8C4WI24_9SAUR
MVCFLVACIACLLFFTAWRKLSRNGKLPPGLVLLTIIGNALQLKTKALSRTPHEVGAPLSSFVEGADSCRNLCNSWGLLCDAPIVMGKRVEFD